MRDPLGVEKLESRGDITNNVNSLLLGEVFPGGNSIKKLTSGDFLEDKIKCLWLLKVLDQIDDILMALQQIKYQSLTL